mgnify:FL=1
MKIRNGTTGDTKEMYGILNNTTELRGFEGGEAYSKDWLEEVANDKKRNIFLVAEKDGEMAGFLIAHILTGRDIFLNDLYVKQNYRKQGIANKLMDELGKFSKKIGSKFSMGLVLTANKKMQNLFRKKDYIKGHTFYYYYKDGR